MTEMLYKLNCKQKEGEWTDIRGDREGGDIGSTEPQGLGAGEKGGRSAWCKGRGGGHVGAPSS